MTDQEKFELLATKVLGWTAGRDFEIRQGRLCFYSWGRWKEWNPLQNIADAWMIVEKLRVAGFGVNVFGSGTGFNCEIYEFTSGTSLADVDGKTAQEAICDAAIKILEVKCE
jgi:hypothetical protein